MYLTSWLSEFRLQFGRHDQRSSPKRRCSPKLSSVAIMTELLETRALLSGVSPASETALLPLDSNASVSEGSTYVLTLGEPDPSLGSVVGYIVHWGDGTNEKFTAIQVEALGRQLPHVYAYGGRDYPITVDVIPSSSPPGLDTSFGAAGQAIATNLDDYFTSAMALDDQGRTYVYTGSAVPVIVRFSADGTIDPTFGTNGMLALGFSTGLPQFVSVDVQGLTIDDQGRFLVAGSVSSYDPATATQNSDATIVRFNPDGSRDTSFGNNGYATFDIAGLSTAGVQRFDLAHGIAIDALGQIVVNGYSSISDNVNSTYREDIFVLKLNSDGSPEATFGDQGVHKLNFRPDTQYSYNKSTDLALHVDGSMALVGYTADRGYSLIRLSATGTVLGVTAISQTNPFNTNFQPRSIAADGAGRMVVAGTGIVKPGTSEWGYLAIRFDTSGAFDTSFGVNGYQFVPFENGFASQVDVRIDQLGRLVFAGTVQDTLDANHPSNPALVRVLTDVIVGNVGEANVTVQNVGNPVLVVSGEEESYEGSPFVLTLSPPDPAFGPVSGYRVHWGDGTTDDFTTAEVDAMERHLPHVYLDGDQTYNVTVDVLRVADSDGLDASFGSGGTFVSTDFKNHYGAASTLDSQGRPYILSSINGLGLQRFSTDGAIDRSFGSNGRLQLGVSGEVLRFNPSVHGLVIDDQGRFVIVGNYTTMGSDGTNSSDLIVLRFNPDGTPDSSLGASGFATFDVGGPSDLSINRLDQGRGVAIDHSGNIVVTGFTTTYDNAGTFYREELFVLRLNSTSSELDLSFGVQGVARLDTNSTAAYSNSQSSDVTVLHDGSIALVGYLQSSNSPALIKLTPAGAFDTAFGTGGIVSLSASPLSRANIRPRSVAEDAVGRLIVAGAGAASLASTNNDFIFLTFSQNGQLETSLGNNGLQTITFANDTLFDFAELHIDRQGRYVVTTDLGSFVNGNLTAYAAVARWNVDHTFSGAGQTSTVVQNVAPSISLSGAATFIPNQPFALTLGSVTDPGLDTISNFVVHWGDGQTSYFTSQGIKTHSYSASLSGYSITIDLEDEDGYYVNRGNSLVVTKANGGPTTMTLSADHVAENLAPGMIIGMFSTSDPDSDDGHTYRLMDDDGDPQSPSFHARW